MATSSLYATLSGVAEADAGTTQTRAIELWPEEFVRGVEEPNFIIVPGADPLTCLWRAFPELRNELDDGESESYYIYGRFADYLASHRDDDQLWQRSYAFFESLALGGGSLQGILVVGLFEPLCEDAVLAERLKNNLGPLARKLLDDMQSFGGPK